MSGTDFIMPIAIAIIMFGIGITLKFKDFQRVFLRPKAIFSGLFAQLVMLPAVEFGLAALMPVDPVYKVGIVLIASAPGGTASNLVTNMLKGRVALSVSMTSFNSFAILFTIPLYVNLALSVFMGQSAEIALSFSETFREILTTVIAPVILGVLMNEYIPDRYTDQLKGPLRYLLPAILLGVFAYALFFENSEQPTALLDNLELFIPLIVLNVSTMMMGYYFAKWVGINHRGAFTIAVEMGLQNSALAIFIATSVLNNSDLSLVAVIYSSFTFFSTWLIGWLQKHYLK